MVETITPVVYGGRGRWMGAVAVHAAAASTVAMVFGAALGWIGQRLGAPYGRPGLLVIGIAAVVYALSEHPRLRVPIPQMRRQVPDWWRTFFGRPVAAVLYGAGVGVGFATYLGHGTLVVVAVAAAATGRPALGALLMAPFGLVRGLTAAAAWGSATSDASRALVERLASTRETGRRVANAGALSAVAAGAILAWRHADAGAWWPVAAAMLGVAFAWASAWKLASFGRWRVALGGHGLPRWLAGPALWAVPASEMMVPALALFGEPRAAAVWALVLVGSFSVELVFVRGRLSGGVPCGCFGGRATVGTGVALARNAALAAAGVLVAVRGVDEPVAGPFSRPATGDLLPLLLATIGLAVATITAWQATVWLSRGSRV
jgi:hypothetical protein